jgi:hypothetical protein
VWAYRRIGVWAYGKSPAHSSSSSKTVSPSAFDVSSIQALANSVRERPNPRWQTLVSCPIDNVAFVRQLPMCVNISDLPVLPLIGRAKNSARSSFGHPSKLSLAGFEPRRGRATSARSNLKE